MKKLFLLCLSLFLVISCSANKNEEVVEPAQEPVQEAVVANEEGSSCPYMEAGKCECPKCSCKGERSKCDCKAELEKCNCKGEAGCQCKEYKECKKECKKEWKKANKPEKTKTKTK